MSTAPGTIADGEDASGAGPAGPAATADPHEMLRRSFKSVVVALRRIRGRDTHRTHRLSFAQYGLLFGLSGMCERSARDLAEQADLSPATVTQMLEALEAQGLVQRTRSEHDRRVVLSALTPRGEKVVAERHAVLEASWRDALAEFSDAELRTSARILDRLAEHFYALDEPDQND